MMPVWADKIGIPRALAVEFPFGQTLGQPGDAAQQNRIICEALQVLETAEKPGTIVHSSEKWKLDTDYSIKAWQPEQPSPIVQLLAPQIRTLLRQKRKETNESDKKLH